MMHINSSIHNTAVIEISPIEKATLDSGKISYNREIKIITDDGIFTLTLFADTSVDLICNLE